MNGDSLITSEFKAIIGECAQRAEEEDMEGVPLWERFRVISHEAGLLLYILVRGTGRMRIAELDGPAGAGSSIIWLGGAAEAVGGDVIGWESNPRRMLKLKNVLSRSRLAPRVHLRSTDPLFGEGAPEPLFDCVLVSLLEDDWPRRVSLGWDLLEPDGLLILTDTIQAGESSESVLDEFFRTRSQAVAALQTGDGMTLACKLGGGAETESELADTALVGPVAALVLDELARESREPGSRLWSIPPETGRLLWLLARVAGAREVLEIGASGGYSGVWLASGLDANDGRLTTMEIDPEKVARARETYERAGVSGRVDLIEGDAFEILPTLSGPFDLVFLDCDKKDYLPLLDHILGLLRPGGPLVADNAISHRDHLKSYLDTVRHHPGLASVTAVIGSGVEITLRL